MTGTGRPVLGVVEQKLRAAAHGVCYQI
jgi:hypothetical protein